MKTKVPVSRDYVQQRPGGSREGMVDPFLRVEPILSSERALEPLFQDSEIQGLLADSCFH